jgi:uncharacterized damage-inducible protein DinB
MIDADYVLLMARYNRWQNENLYGAADRLTDEARRQDQGAFFGSIHRTFSHLAWGDGTWISRFTPRPAPAGTGKGSPDLYQDWEELKEVRRALDRDILAWAESIDPAWLAGDISWFSGVTQSQQTRKAWTTVVHFFNHQTHHRGQVHAMLTRLGVKPDDTDLFLLPP